MAKGRELLSSSTLDSESFRIYCYKIVPCAKKFGHDWSECPFAHDGEKATRRCPALYRYSSIVCPEIRQSRACPRGDVCPYSHSIFEYWMHPARFRAQICSYGAECNRRICFFAHSQDQLRTPSEPVAADALGSRAPYLQGRVAPESRFALYPEQVPAIVPMQGALLLGQQQQQQQQQQLLQQQADLASGMQLQQVVYRWPTGTPQTIMTPAPARSATTQVAAGQQWGAGGSSMVIVPAAQAGASAGMGYYVAGPSAVGAGGSDVTGAGLGSGGGAAGYSAPMMVTPGMQVVGGSYGSQQPVQLMTAMAADGSMQQYPIAPGGLGPGMIAYAPVFPAAQPGQAGIPMQQWSGSTQRPQPQQAVQPPQPPPPQQHPQQHPRHQQQPLQLVQVPEGPEAAAGISRPPPEFLLAPAAQLAASRGLSGVADPQFAVMGSHLGAAHGLGRGPGVVSGSVGGAAGSGMVQQGPSSAPGDSGRGGVAPSVDDIAQQMAGWHMQ